MRPEMHRQLSTSKCAATKLLQYLEVSTYFQWFVNYRKHLATKPIHRLVRSPKGFTPMHCSSQIRSYSGKEFHILDWKQRLRKNAELLNV